MAMKFPEINQYKKYRSNLFWYIHENKKEDISPELLIETIFNYGTLADALELFSTHSPPDNTYRHDNIRLHDPQYITNPYRNDEK
jgi:hypothetical protein